jgi:AcrR family transcriptional regulator
MARTAGRDGRAAILAAAGNLFYEHGLETTSVEAVAALAGVTKKALYYHFPTKHDLVLAYLDAADEPALALLRGLVRKNPAQHPHPYVRLLEGLRNWLKSGRFHGCAFLRAARAHPDDPLVLEAATRHKNAVLLWLETLAGDSGSTRPRQLALEFRLLVDGILATGNLYGADALIDTAQRTLSALIGGEAHNSTPRQVNKDDKRD